jgi:hypothetical protein
LIQGLIENSNEHNENAQNLSGPTLLAETDDGPDARRRHDPVERPPRRRFATSASNERLLETSTSAAEHSFGDAVAIATVLSVIAVDIGSLHRRTVVVRIWLSSW